MAESNHAGDDPGALPEDVLTVGELNDRISDVIDSATDLRDVQVVGEVIDCSESNVALYFGLTDGTHRVQCMLWKSRYADMDVDIEDGIEVVLSGAVDYWQDGGTLSVKPWLVHPIGDGDQFAALERLRAELEDRGWFDDAHTQALPEYPTTVGVVTSRNGDARHDIQDAIHTRYPDVDIVLEHASVQGDNAPPELADGIVCLDEDPSVDVVIVGRGGGSDDDLMAFNTELVAEAVFHASTPIVTAVGHREDVTIADNVADHSAITPTAAGKAVVRDRMVVEAEVNDLQAGIIDTYESHVDATLADLDSALADAYHRTTTRRLDDLEDGLEHAYATATRTALTELEHDLAAAYRAVEHEHEKQEAIEAATAEAATVPTVYKAAIVLLVILLALALIALFVL